MATVLANVGRAMTTGAVIHVGSGNGSASPNDLGLGSGAGTSAVADTTLFTEYTTGTWSGYARATATATQQTTSVTSDTVQLVATTTNNSGFSQTVTNAGFFDATSAGNLFLKGDFTGIPLANGDSITVTGKVQYN